MTDGSAGSFAKLTTEVESWAAETLGNYVDRVRANPPVGEKIVRDAVHGYQSLRPWEVAILDSPIVQRLHQIHQTGLGYLVYPSANHTRFEHSLGVCYMVTALAHSGQDRGFGSLFESPYLDELRLAALLHDVGHSFFSHSSEVLLESMFSSFEEIRTELGIRSKAGEILSYLIVRSGPMQRLLHVCMEHYDRNWDVDRMASLIVGTRVPMTREGGMDQYLADMINGPFDADKMDYLLRDSHVTGIKGDVDVQRLWYAFTVYNDGAQVRRMAMDSVGVPILEQILFSKMQLYTSMYHHHKVRAIECMVKGLFEVIADRREEVRNPSLRFETVSDFLRTDDLRFMGAALEEQVLQPRVEALLRRDLLKRALHISRRSVVAAQEEPVGMSGPSNLDTLVALGDIPTADLRAVRQLIFDEIPGSYQTELADLWVDLPSGPSLSGEAMRCLVVFGRQPQSPVENLYKLFPLDRWLESYEQNKWSGHVFYVGSLEHRTAANKAAREVFRQWPGLEFHQSATSACKLNL